MTAVACEVYAASNRMLNQNTLHRDAQSLPKWADSRCDT